MFTISCFMCIFHKSFCLCLLLVQVSLEERVSLRTSMILRQSSRKDSGTDGTVGPTKNGRSRLSSIQHLDLSGASIQTGQTTELKIGKTKVTLNLMMSNAL